MLPKGTLLKSTHQTSAHLPVIKSWISVLANPPPSESSSWAKIKGSSRWRREEITIFRLKKINLIVLYRIVRGRGTERDEQAIL